MSDLNAFFGPNAGYVLELYDRYLQDPNSVDAETRSYFEHFTPPAPGAAATTATTTAAPFSVGAVVGAASLAQAVREFGHLAVQLDPLGSPPQGAPELAAAFHGISDADLRAIPAMAVPSEATDGAANAAEAIDRLRAIYSAGIGYDFDHVQIAEERAWLRHAVETGAFDLRLDPDEQRRLLQRLTEVEGFEKFIH
ncbi:MAG TPA: 2-oxoglutarate dehydrogenase E1 component, partial [Thermomicrobiales bacterium]|nr:2-oxoglutarate dehydrogenase E1 component [Thermomicrobiales bacterium]